MATFRGVAGFLLRNVGENAFVRRSSSRFLRRSRTINGQITALQGQMKHNSSKNDQINKDEPIAYSKSPAQQHKVNDTLQYDSSKINSYRAFIISFGMFSLIVYYGFIHEETEAEQKIFEFNEMQENSPLESEEENAPESELSKT